jgi:hypothetical protein
LPRQPNPRGRSFSEMEFRGRFIVFQTNNAAHYAKVAILSSDL